MGRTFEKRTESEELIALLSYEREEVATILDKLAEEEEVYICLKIL